MNPIQCLLIQTRDKRRFFTHEKHLISLIEFAKVFGAEISLVTVETEEKKKILELKDLALAICSSSKTAPVPYTVVDRLFPKVKKSRKKIITNSTKIAEYIHKSLMDGRSVSLKELKKRFKAYSLTDACLCNHLSKIRKDLSQQGYTIVKIGAGTYCVEQPTKTRV